MRVIDFMEAEGGSVSFVGSRNYDQMLLLWFDRFCKDSVIYRRKKSYQGRAGHTFDMLTRYFFTIPHH